MSPLALRAGRYSAAAARCAMSIVAVAQLLALFFALAAAALAGIAHAFAGQTRLDADAAHHAETVHAQKRAPAARLQRRALHVLEAAHDRGAADVDCQPRRHDDVH